MDDRGRIRSSGLPPETPTSVSDDSRERFFASRRQGCCIDLAWTAPGCRIGTWIYRLPSDLFGRKGGGFAILFCRTGRAVQQYESTRSSKGQLQLLAFNWQVVGLEATLESPRRRWLVASVVRSCVVAPA